MDFLIYHFMIGVKTGQVSYLKKIFLLSADRVTLTFVALNLETSSTGCYDYVQVLDGDDLDAPGGDPICGTTLPSPVTSFGSSMVVNFISDGSNHGTGFRAIYSTAGAGWYSFIFPRFFTVPEPTQNECVECKKTSRKKASCEHYCF